MDVDTAGLRFGVEEEFLVVDPVTRAVVPQAEAVLDRARQRLGARVGGEITTFQLETRTEPCRTVEELHAQLVEARGALAAAAGAEGLRVVATGSPVLGRAIPSPITEGARQDRGNATFRGLHDEMCICALHVHVELPDRDRALAVGNHLRPYLPALIALAANSPYWAERDTGYASWRTLVWHRWPVAGPPPYFTSAAQHDALIETLLASGALVDMGTVFWDIRLSVRQPTLEFRVMDMPITAGESALFAALVRALVAGVLPAVDAGDPGPVVPAELLRLAYWRAARDGLSGHGVDARTGRLLPAADLTQRLLDLARPALAAYDDLDRVTGGIRRLVEGGDGATRQRRAASRRGLLADVIDHLVIETAGVAGSDSQQSTPA